jgi:D-glycero-D-manno-heptose 1,7-bisphosphate phosphatase
MKTEMKAAIFLDRDGTISPDDFGYLNDPDKYYLYPYSADAIKLFQKLNFYVFLVSNQGGVARGYITLEQMKSVMQRAQDCLAAEGVVLDRVFFSPYYSKGVVEPYNIEHEDRKPGLGMFKKALSEFKFRPEHSWMIGDRYSDIVFGYKAGMKTILLLSGNGEKAFHEEMPGWEIKPDFVIKDLMAAANFISSYTNKQLKMSLPSTSHPTSQQVVLRGPRRSG